VLRDVLFDGIVEVVCAEPTHAARGDSADIGQEDVSGQVCRGIVNLGPLTDTA